MFQTCTLAHIPSEAGLLLNTLLHNWHSEMYKVRGGKKSIRDTCLQSSFKKCTVDPIFPVSHIGVLAQLRTGQICRHIACMRCWRTSTSLCANR